MHAMGEQFHLDPVTYEAMMAREVPAYDRLQAAVASAAVGPEMASALELGIGTGRTATAMRRILPGARLVAIDANAQMLLHAGSSHPDAELRVARIEDELPMGPFDLVYSALAVHHLHDVAKADLFRRVAAVLRPGGRFVLGDVVVPDDPGDAVTPLDAVEDRPSTIAAQRTWLSDAGFTHHLAWRERDLAVLVGDLARPPGSPGPGVPPTEAAGGEL